MDKVLKKSPNEVDDEVDSDFSIDENDEPRSDNEEDESSRKKLKRGAGVQTKAYKEPKQKPSKPVAKISPSDYGRKPTRASTALKTSETIKKIKKRDAISRKKKLKLKKVNKEYRKLTQEEILEEAKLTEQVNLASLSKYVEMELEAKRRACQTGKRIVHGPAVRYQSVTMPRVEPKVDVKEEEDVKPETAMDCDADDVFEKKPPLEEIDTKPSSQGRTFISFTDDDTMKSNFSKSSYKIPSVKTCPITRLPAKYFDPVTQLPYANLQAFKILREAYYQQLELKGDRNDPEIASWLEWRTRNKPVKPILTSVNRPPPAFTNTPVPGVRPQGQQQQQQQPANAVLATPPKPAPPPQIKQSVVLPTRPVMATHTPVLTPLATAPTNVVYTTTPPTSTPSLTPVSAPPVPIQTLKVTATPTASPGTTPRTIATTTLTAAQLQQLAAARGQVFVNQLRAGQMSGGAVRQVSVGQIAGAQMQRARQIIGRTVAVSGTGPTIMRTAGQANAGLIVSQQPRHQTVTVQRPQVSQVGVAVGGGVSRVTGGRAQVGAGPLVA